MATKRQSLDESERRLWAIKKNIAEIYDEYFPQKWVKFDKYKTQAVKLDYLTYNQIVRIHTRIIETS